MRYGRLAELGPPYSTIGEESKLATKRVGGHE